MTNKTKKNKAFRINSARIKECLVWLKANNEQYFDIEIDFDELERLEKVEYYHEIEGANVKFIDEEEQVDIDNLNIQEENKRFQGSTLGTTSTKE